MANELPYFRFTVQAWQNGKVAIESYELQGLFISVCGFYWINDCSVTLAMLKKKFSNATILLDQLIELRIIKHEMKHDKIKIDFLLMQHELLSEKRKIRQYAGSKGGNAKAMLKQKHSYKDKDKDKDNTSYSFKNFWDAYDKKIGAKKCEMKWSKLTEGERLAAMLHIPAYVKSTPDPKYRKNPETYLNNHSWDDQIILFQDEKHPYTDQQWTEAIKRIRMDGNAPIWFDMKYIDILRKEAL